MRRTRNGFTLIELLIVIAILALLISILAPTLQEARRLAKIAKCLSNLRNTLTATLVYTSEYDSYPYSWRHGVAHTEIMSHHYMQVYDDGDGEGMLSPHPHQQIEGDGLAPYWEYYLIHYDYAEAGMLGCGFSAPTNWQVWPSEFYRGAGIEINDVEQIQRIALFVYRGPSSTDDHRNSVYACGQIAGGGSSDPRFGGRSGAWYPQPHLTLKPAPLFHDPVWVDRRPDHFENYAAAHSGLRRGIRNRSIWPMSIGWGRYGHFVDQGVGWSDGAAQTFTQPDDDQRYFINYDRLLVDVDRSNF